MDLFYIRLILAILSDPFPVVLDGKIHQGLLILARRVHWIQSRILRLPDRFGLVSSGPPLLQAHQAHKIANVIVGLDITSLFVGAVIAYRIVLRTRCRQTSVSIMVLAALYFWNLVLVYVEEIFFNPMRAPDYDWEALHKRMGLMQS